ncbi:unnamed protein product [Caenorhabditis nigoni]
MPIALLKFPTDLLGEVFKQCNPFELYFLSKCSKKAQKTVKLGGKKNWKISYWGSKKIMICRDDLKYTFDPTNKPEDYFKMESDKCMKTPKKGTFNMFFYLLETFGIRIVESLEIQPRNFHNFSKITKVLIGRNMEIETFYLGETLDLKDVVNFMPLISQMRITMEFQCWPKFPPDFHYQFVNYPSYIQIDFAFWFNISQLLSCTCTRIRLGYSGLSNQDLNVFLQTWKTVGAFPNLQCLEIISENIDNKSAILEMVPPITREENPQKQVYIRLDDGDHIFMYGAVRIYKEDGTEAWLKVELGDVPELRFIVCNADNTEVQEIDWNDDDHEGVEGEVPIEEYENRASDDEEIEDSDEEESDEEESDEEESDVEESDYEESSDEN